MELELHHVAILCDDLEESLRFYRDTLRLQVVVRHYQEGIVDMTSANTQQAYARAREARERLGRQTSPRSIRSQRSGGKKQQEVKRERATRYARARRGLGGYV